MAKRDGQSVTLPAKGAGSRRFSLREAVLMELDPDERAELISLQGEAFKIYAVLTPLPPGRRYLELCNKGWARLQRRLAAGELIATGLDPEDRSGEQRPIARHQWLNAQVNFETWVVQIYAVTFVQIEVSTIGGLHISQTPKQVRLGIYDLELEGRPFDVLLTLAKAAKSQPGSIVSNAVLNKEHIKGDASSKELGRVVYFIRQALITKAGETRADAKKLVENIPNQGYRLNMPPDEIFL